MNFSIGILVPAILLLAGCSGIAPSYVRADRATFDALAPEYRNYLERDMALRESERAMRLQTIQSWELRLRSAERSLGHAND